jgi:hypothetical protein
MKKRMWSFVAILIAIVLFIGISMFVYGDPEKPTTTILLNSLSVEHPARISIFAPQDARVAQMVASSDFRMTSLIPYEQSIDEAVNELNIDSSFRGYFETVTDIVNENNMRVVVLGPKNVRNDNLDFFVVFASQKNGSPNVTSKFEIKCVNRTADASAKLTQIKVLDCEQARSVATMIASSINIFDTKAWEQRLQEMKAESERQLETAKQKALDASR